MTEFIRLRPHHLLCTQAYVGKGYNEAFTNNADDVVRTLRVDAALVAIVAGPDDLCSACPHCQPSGRCDSQEIVERLDDAVATTFSLTPGIQSYKTLANHLRQSLTPHLFKSICGPCSWLKSGLCSSFFFPHNGAAGSCQPYSSEVSEKRHEQQPSQVQ